MYDDSFWLEALAIQGSVGPRVFRKVLVFVAFASFVCVVHGRWPGYTINLGPHEVIGVVLALLLVVRTNAGYERWWEARKLWGGIVNQSRNLVVGALAHGPQGPWRLQVIHATAEFARAALRALRIDPSPAKHPWPAAAEPGDRPALGSPTATAVALELARLFSEARAAGTLDPFALLLLERERAILVEHVGGCERILKTPLPHVLSLNIRRYRGPESPFLQGGVHLAAIGQAMSSLLRSSLASSRHLPCSSSRASSRR